MAKKNKIGGEILLNIEKIKILLKYILTGITLSNNINFKTFIILFLNTKLQIYLYIYEKYKFKRIKEIQPKKIS